MELKRPKLVLLDVYETMLDMSEIEKKVNSLLDNKRGYNMWFELFMQYCFVDNCIEQFNNFSSIAKASMQMAAVIFDKKIDPLEINFVLDLLKHLPIRNHVQEGLSKLADTGFRIAALTNSTEAIVKQRMERTGLISYFEQVLSAEYVKKYKPCIEVYKWAAEKSGLNCNEILMVTTHGWDIAGADNAGMQTAYINQTDYISYSFAAHPDYIANNLEDLAIQLAETDSIEK